MPTAWATRGSPPRISTRSAAPRSGRKSVTDTRGMVSAGNLSLQTDHHEECEDEGYAGYGDQ